jgi:hypothetical protein
MFDDQCLQQLIGRSPAWLISRHWHTWVGQADVGDVRQDPALAARAGDSDPMAPVEHVVLAAASVQVHRVHSAAGQDIGGYPLKARSRHL